MTAAEFFASVPDMQLVLRGCWLRIPITHLPSVAKHLMQYLPLEDKSRACRCCRLRHSRRVHVHPTTTSCRDPLFTRLSLTSPRRRSLPPMPTRSSPISRPGPLSTAKKYTRRFVLSSPIHRIHKPCVLKMNYASNVVLWWPRSQLEDFRCFSMLRASTSPHWTIRS